ncbi:MAG TPA: phosphoribosylamine--glycine ligase [Bacteroidales bacterium]|nr:phosphoribosylamine--glycine ligase [Bacteroidales bacterium]
MNALVVGSGGREHALAWKLRQSTLVDKLFIAPGNAGTMQLGQNLPLDVNDLAQLRMACIEQEIQLVVVGPEQPLVNGIVDFFRNDAMLNNIAIIGPTAAGARLEGSKAFAKDFMTEFGIPTAGFIRVNLNNFEEGIGFLRSSKPPYVLKADGLAAGKGVLIIDNKEEAEAELEAMLRGKFGKASETVVIEEFLKGIELSVFVITDGKSYKMLPSAKDYKRIGENDTGPNTGGMGAVSPVPFADRTFMLKVKEQIIEPTIHGIQRRGMDYHGFIFFGLINVDGNPFVIEYNVRLGDPEAECILPRMKGDLVSLLMACHQGRLHEVKTEIDDRFAVTFIMASGGYPETFAKGKPVNGLQDVEDCLVFHSGTSISVDNGGIKTAGGRVLALTAMDFSIEEARAKALKGLSRVSFDSAYYRRDIGLDLISRQFI